MTLKEADNILITEIAPCSDCANKDIKLRKCALHECKYGKALLTACKSLEAWKKVIDVIKNEIKKRPEDYGDDVLDAQTVFNGIAEVYTVGERHGLEMAIDIIKKRMGEVEE